MGRAGGRAGRRGPDGPHRPPDDHSDRMRVIRRADERLGRSPVDGRTRYEWKHSQNTRIRIGGERADERDDEGLTALRRAIGPNESCTQSRRTSSEFATGRTDEIRMET